MRLSLPWVLTRSWGRSRRCRNLLGNRGFTRRPRAPSLQSEQRPINGWCGDGAPLEEAIKEFDIRADKFIGEQSDIIWNKLDRPANDPTLSIILPGGISAYTEGPNDEQPDRMDLFAELLEAGVHPRLDATLANGIAKDTRAVADEYRTKVEAARRPRAKAALLEKVKIALARAGQIELVNLKRRWLSERFTEAEIHTVIPDRPTAKPSKDDK